MKKLIVLLFLVSISNIKAQPKEDIYKLPESIAVIAKRLGGE